MTTNNSDRNSPGFWMNLINSFRIAWRLMWDNRVPLSAKLVPLAAILYLISPVDFLPEILIPIPGVGYVDDLGIILLGIRLFIAISPKDIVARIRAEIEGRPPNGAPKDGWTVTGSRPHDSGEDRSSASKDVIDG